MGRIGRPVLVVLALSAPTAMQTQTSPPSSACAQPEYRQFDFWVGRWTVKRPDRTIAGHNVITREHGGCVLLESWTGTGGVTGRSLNIFDAATKRWHQTW